MINIYIIHCIIIKDIILSILFSHFKFLDPFYTPKDDSTVFVFYVFYSNGFMLFISGFI